MSIEFYTNAENPYFTDEPTRPSYHRALSSGLSNVEYDNLVIVTEDTPLFPLLSHSYLRIRNRERKVLLAVDLSHVEHLNPQLLASDGTNTTNQSGDSNETFLNPPSSLVPCFRPIEFYKKDSFDRLGIVKDYFSPISYPEPSLFDMRQIRLDFGILRTNNGTNPGGKSLKYGSLFSSSDSDAFKFLVVSSDIDYPEENEMTRLNNLFELTENGVVIFDIGLGGTRNAVWPQNWKIQRGQSGLTNLNTPEVKDSLFHPVFKSVSIPTNKFLTDVQPSITSETYPFWNMLGVYRVFEGTSEAERGAKSRYRYDHNRVTIATFNSYPKITNHNNISSTIFTLNENYFYDMEYTHKSSDDFLLWESDQGTAGNQWFPFIAGGYIDIADIGDKVRHKFVNDFMSGRDFKNSNYDIRISQGAQDIGDGFFIWDNWQYSSQLIPYSSEEIYSSNFTIQGNPGDQDEQYFRIELGRKGGRGIAYVVDFIKQNATFNYNLKLDILINRKVFKGDLLKYEILVDSMSADNKFYLDIEYYNTGLSGSTSFLSSLISIFNPSNTSDPNKWTKIEVPLDQIEGKYIKYIVFRSSESNGQLGRCVGYFNEIQLLNIMDQFNGRQFISNVNYGRQAIKDNTDPHSGIYSQAYKPIVMLVGYLSDRLGNIVDHKISAVQIDQEFDNPGNGDDSDLKWFISTHVIPYSRFLKKVSIFYGIPKTMQVALNEMVGPNPGGRLDIERAYLLPTNSLDFILSYSTEDWNGGNIYDPIDSFIDYTNLGYKSWAVQLRSKYVEV